MKHYLKTYAPALIATAFLFALLLFVNYRDAKNNEAIKAQLVECEQVYQEAQAYIDSCLNLNP